MIHINGIKDEMIANNLTPFRFTHPGEIVKDELEDRGISQRKFAERIGMSYSVLNELLNAHRPLTTNTALLFEAALGLPADMLLRIQTKYNLQTARKDKEIIRWMAKIRNAAAVL
jgi:addiction module HigA family antidote